MLTRVLNVYSDDQVVTFKYMRKSDYADFLNTHASRRNELRERWKEVGQQGDGPERRQVEGALMKLEQQESYKAKLVDLEGRKDGKVILVLHRAVERAKQAAQLAEQAFSGVKFKGLLNSLDAPNLVQQVLKVYFCGADGKKDLGVIRDTFQMTARGLAGSVSISDCAGRERAGGQLAEGIVPMKKASQAKMDREVRSLSELYEKKKRGKSPKKAMRLDDDLYVEQQYLMRKYLASGDTGSIHVEFSYIGEYSVDAIARIILHESTHKFAATADFGYADKHTIEKLKPAQAILNADSYAYAGISLLRKELVTAKALNSERPPAIDEAGLDGLLDLERDLFPDD
jgi:hypothetical protein